MKKCIGIILWASLGLFACTPNNVKSDAGIVKILDSAGTKGSFALLENGSEQFIISDLSRYKDSAYSPLQTAFSIPTLIALDKGWINHTPSTWVSTDSVSFYQSLIEKVGRADLLKSIDSIHYGKGIVGTDLSSFWNNASLLITPDEQLGFIKKLYFNQLPFQKRSQDIYKKMILKEDNASYQLSYIQGSSTITLPTAWIVGYIEENKHPYFFVMHLTAQDNNHLNQQKSVLLLKRILSEQGFLKGVR